MDSLLHYLDLNSILFLLAGAFFVAAAVSRCHRKPLPPGPKGHPLIGSMNLMDQMTHRGLARLAHEYGGIFHMRMGFLHMVTVSSPEAARQVLQVQDNIFSNRPASIAIRYLTYDRADLVFAHYGPFWRQMRKLAVVKLFSRKRAESWASVRDEVSRLTRAVSGSVGSPVNVGKLVSSLAKNIIYRAAFGSASNEGQDEFISILQDISKLFRAFNWADFIPGLGWADPSGLNARLVKARKSLDRFIDTIIDDHLEKKRKGIKGAEDDIVDELLVFYSEGEGNVTDSDDLQSAIRLTKNNIKAIIMDVMFGGTETVASAIEWAMSEVMKCPEVMKRAQSELTEVVGLHRCMEEADLDKLPYFRCVIKETLRLHPPVPLLLHETAKEVTVMGYRVPARARVTINAWAIGRDKDSWADPDTFRPERFLEEGAPNFKGGSFEFIPFGSGRRSCPGMQLGLYALEMTVANLLHCFTWELPDGMKPTELDMSDSFGLSAPRASRLIAVPSQRLAGPIS